jgi:ATP sulfurylase
MNTEQYAKEVYCNHSKTKTASQQRIRKMIADNKKLPQVIRIDTVGKYHLLHVMVH